MKSINFKKEIFGKIETKEDAVKINKDTVNLFLFFGIIVILISFYLGGDVGADAFINGTILAILALFLRKFNSRIAAVLLLILSIGNAIITVINKFTGGQGGKNIFLALIIIWAGIRATQASFIYNKQTIKKIV